MAARTRSSETGPHIARTTIRPGSRFAALDLREIWSKRELLYFFVWRDLKVRYKQTAFGAAWAVIQPLGLMLVFSLVLGRVEGVAPEGVPYPLFALVALVPWTLFSQSLIGASESLVDAAQIIQKVYFPRVLLPIAAVGSYLLDFAIGMVVLLIALVISGYIPTLTALAVIPLTALAVAAALAVGVWLSAVNVRYRDVRYAVPFLAQLWLFASPVAYSAAIVPDELWFIYHLNPMAGVIEGFRWALLGSEEAPIAAIAMAVVVSSVTLGVGLQYFRRVERTFADVI